MLAAQMGYLPGTLWSLIGDVFGGCVQDSVVLAFSTRKDGVSLGKVIRVEIGLAVGVIALFGVLAIMIILLAVLGPAIVKALAQSSWSTFTA